MSDGQIPKPSQRMKASSGSIPHLGGKTPPPRPPSTTRIRTATGSTRRSTAEVVASSDEGDMSEVRQRVATPASSSMGLSLRWKIVLSMAVITIATEILIFVSVNSKAVAQLSDEIDAKGVRLVKTLATIDAALWKAAIQPSTADRKRKLDFLAQKFNPELTPAARENL